MSATDLQVVTSPSSSEDLAGQTGVPLPAQPTREKTKRPQLSCNPCRTRKVKVGSFAYDRLGLTVSDRTISVIGCSRVLPALCIR